MPQTSYSFICGVHGATIGTSDRVECREKASGDCRPVGYNIDLAWLLGAVPSPDAQPTQMEQRMEQVAWLVECPKYHPGKYFALCECGCGRHHWTTDVHKATKFLSKEVAETARGGDVNCIAVEHLFGLEMPRPTVDLGELEPDGTGIDTSPERGNSPEEQRADVGGTPPRKAADLGEDGELIEAISDDECVICGKTKAQHSKSSGYGVCQIYPMFQSKRETVKLLLKQARAVLSRG